MHCLIQIYQCLYVSWVFQGHDITIRDYTTCIGIQSKGNLSHAVPCRVQANKLNNCLNFNRKPEYNILQSKHLCYEHCAGAIIICRLLLDN
jgi:hypothetical protein